MNVLVVLTNENMGSDHVEGEKRHANNKSPGRLALANVLQSPSQMEETMAGQQRQHAQQLLGSSVFAHYSQP